jgi:hypothetical protein
MTLRRVCVELLYNKFCCISIRAVIMSKFARSLIVISLLMLFIGFSVSVSGQATEEADPRATVIKALANLAQQGNYAYTIEASSLATYTDKKGQVIHADSLFSSAGEVDANQNFRDSFTERSGVTLEEAQTAVPYQVERVKVGDEIYVSLPANLLTQLRLSLAPGWWRSRELITQVGNQAMKINLGNLVNAPSPTKFSISENTIEAVTDAGTKMIDQREMEVYDLKINGSAYLLEQPDGTTISSIVQYLKALNLLKGNKTSVSASFWFGLDDGRLYGGTSEVDILLPLLSLTGDSRAGYDLEIKASYTATVSYPDQPVEITPPDESLLNHQAATM